MVDVMTRAISVKPAVSGLPAEPQSESTALIAMLERAARDPAVDLPKMERLFELQQRAVAARSKTAFLAAFSGLQSDLPAAARGGTGHNQKRYARFEDLITALRPVLASHGFSLSFRVNTEGHVIRVTGILGHRDGHAEQTEMVLPPDTSGGKTPVHAMGSSIAYGKRYVTLSLTGIATDDDDDGKAAAGGTINEKQEAELREKLESSQADVAKFCAYFKIEKFADLKVADFPRAITALSKKASK